MKLSVPRYLQGEDDFACGPTCLCMCLDYLLSTKGAPKLDHSGIKKVERLTMDGNIWSSSGTRYERMVSTIRRMGFRCRRIQGKDDPSLVGRLRQAIDEAHPVVLGCMADLGGDRLRHYIVVVGVERSRLLINDPYPKRRPKSVPFQSFLKAGTETCWGRDRWGIEIFC